MTEIEKKALALVNEVNRLSCCHMGEVGSVQAVKALLRAIEQHELFKQEVSDAVENALIREKHMQDIEPILRRFILTNPDPLVEVIDELGLGRSSTAADELRQALAARGLEIVEKKQ